MCVCVCVCVCVCMCVCVCLLKTVLVCMWHHTGDREGEGDEGGLGAAADELERRFTLLKPHPQFLYHTTLPGNDDADCGGVGGD